MRITKQSPISGKWNIEDLPISIRQWEEYTNPNKDRSIQHIMPHLTSSQREFLISGITAEEWDATFKEEEYI